MLWVRLAKIKGGFLFPCCEELWNLSIPTVYHYPYNNFLTDIKFLYYNILGKPYNPLKIVGTHTCRKTKLLLATFGNYKDEWSDQQALRCSTKKRCVFSIIMQ